jgi:hypothetical protein
MSNCFVTDSFTDNCNPGKTIGTASSNGILRKGIDVEKTIAIDNGALRFQPLINPGWGRQGIVYGPYTRTNGLAFAVLLLNGHNTSQVETIEWLNQRLYRWIIGNETESIVQRLFKWLKSRQKKGTWRRLLWWVRIAAGVTKFFPLPSLDENLAVGWFTEEIPTNPIGQGNAFIVHATGAENGELWANIGDRILSIFKGLQNVQVYYVVILRETGAAYYAASVPNTYGLTAYPYLRPVAIDPFNQEKTLFAGVYQSVLGQIGFKADTRIYGVKIQQIPELNNWYGTAYVADRLIGDSSLENRTAEVGGYWQVYRGNYQLTPQGLIAQGNNNLAILNTNQPSGLIHLLIETKETITDFSLVWRSQDENNYFCFQINSTCCSLLINQNGLLKILAISKDNFLSSNQVTSLQVRDDGESFAIYLDGKLVFYRQFKDSRWQDGTGIGITSIEANPNLYIRYLEAHPCSIPLPSELDIGSPWWMEGKQIIIQDNFAGKLRDLAGTITTKGNEIWRREIGKGSIFFTEDGIAKVKADAQHPNPGRTAYTITWDYPQLADIEVEIIAPGKERGQGEKGRAGLIFWQDTDNYIIINTWLDDFYEGESISSFFCIDGFEEIYDAVWSNIGNTISFGKSYTLRVIFDGINYLVRVNNQTVLYRALSDVYPDIQPLAINRVGIVANWEWGNDTGSSFKNFIAKV